MTAMQERSEGMASARSEEWMFRRSQNRQLMRGGRA